MRQLQGMDSKLQRKWHIFVHLIWQTAAECVKVDLFPFNSFPTIFLLDSDGVGLFLEADQSEESDIFETVALKG